MYKQTISIFICLLVILAGSIAAYPDSTLIKPAIVLEVLAINSPGSLKSLQAFEKELKDSFPGIDIYRSCSKSYSHQTAEEHQIYSLANTMARLADEGYTHIAVMPLYIIADENYKKTESFANGIRSIPDTFKEINIIPPLIDSEEDVFDLASYLIYSLPSEMSKGEAVLFIAHGSNTGGSMAYPALNWAMLRLGERGTIYMAASLENADSLKSSADILRINRIRTVWIIPLMAVTDREAEAELFGKGSSSIPSQLATAGITCKTVEHGLLENPAVSAYWKKKLKISLITMLPQKVHIIYKLQ